MSEGILSEAEFQRVHVWYHVRGKRESACAGLCTWECALKLVAAKRCVRVPVLAHTSVCVLVVTCASSGLHSFLASVLCTFVLVCVSLRCSKSRRGIFYPSVPSSLTMSPSSCAKNPVPWTIFPETWMCENYRKGLLCCRISNSGF